MTQTDLHQGFSGESEERDFTRSDLTQPRIADYDALRLLALWDIGFRKDAAGTVVTRLSFGLELKAGLYMADLIPDGNRGIAGYQYRPPWQSGGCGIKPSVTWVLDGFPMEAFYYYGYGLYPAYFDRMVHQWGIGFRFW